MSKLTFYGGVNEIGGNKILLEDKQTKIFLDFGLSFSKYGKYYSDFLQPRLANGIGDFLDLGIIPDIDGIYRNDLLKNEGRKTAAKPEIDGVFLSHAHADHSWNISLLHKEMKIYCGETTKIILKAIQESSQMPFYGDFYWYKENFVDRKKKPTTERHFNTFRTGKKIKLDDIEVEPIHVDHSIPGAYAFIIHTSSGSIGYTGDIRLHGPKGYMTTEFIERARDAKLDLLLSEGTRVGNEKKTMTEQEVHKKIKEIISSTKNLVIANFPARDVDRLNSFFQACVESGRQLAIPTKMAYLIEELQQDNGLQLPSLNEVIIYLQKTWWGRYEENDYSSWERKFLKLNTVTAEEVNKNQNKYVVFLDYFDLKELINIKPKEGSNYIYSISEPHDEEQMIDYERMQNWLRHFHLPLHTAHASGHASWEEIKEIVKLIDAKKVVPIHTEHPLLFKQFTDNVALVEYGKSISVD